MAWLAELKTEMNETDGRGAPRRRLQLRARAAAGSEAAADVLIHNISTTGLLLETTAPLQKGEAIAVDLPEAGTTEAMIMWQSNGFYGCRFEGSIGAAAVSAAQLRSSWIASPEPDAGTPALPPVQGLSPRRKVAIIVGLALASWALVGIIALAVT